ARDRRVPVLPALEPLLPGAGLRRGSTVAVGAAPGVTGATSLALALAAGASRDGSWVAAVGLGSLGLVAAAELGVALERFVVVADPGRRDRHDGERQAGAASHRAGWPAGVGLVAAGPGASRRAAAARRRPARVRGRGAVLVAVGGELPGERSPVRLSVVASRWSGLDRGTGHLRCREATVEATGRGDATR